jgi:xylitol oxidase
MPSAGDELQSEYLVARADAVGALVALAGLRARLSSLVQVSEIRTVAADGLWLSPAYRRDSVALHFTWKPDAGRVMALLPDIEAVLEPFEPRPHWGKLFAIDAEVLRSRYERRGDFVSLARRLDPAGKFRNEFVDQFVFGAPTLEA